MRPPDLSTGRNPSTGRSFGNRGPDMTTAVIIVAAGRGSRAGGDLPKQWQMLAGQPLVAHAIAAFRGMVDITLLALHPDDLGRAQGLAAEVVTGGDTRQDTVLRALLVTCQADEIEHRDEARAAVHATSPLSPGPANDAPPGALLRLWCRAVGSGSALAVAIARRL